MRAALAFARETGSRDIPSYKALRKAQARMRNILGNPTVRKVSYAGNMYYMNRITSGLGQDLANPLLRKHMSFYPHYDDNRMSQIWHGGKLLKDVPDHVLTPMIRHNNQIYYVGELVQRMHGWFLPLQWMLKGEQHKMYAIGHNVEETQMGLQVRSDRRISVPVASFICSFPELLQRDAVPVFDEGSQTFRTNMPHPLRAIAGLRPVYSIPIILFMDDVSGNKTNVWSKHISAYILNAAITREVLNMEYSVRFVLTSKHATPSELMEGIRDDLEESFQMPIVAYDCQNEEEVLIRGYPALSAADNPMQSEQCSCQLQNANYFCRTCGAGGTSKFKQSESGYETLFKPGEMRSPAQTRERVNTLLDMSIQPGQRTRIKEQARDWGVKDSHGQLIIDKMLDMGQKMREARNGRYYKSEREIIASLQAELDSARQQGCINAFLDMEELGFDVHKDTPTEILHTMLLGVVKYFWSQTVFVLSRAHRMSTLETRLGSLNISGLNIDSISEKYMCQYTGLLVGKHFKTLAQLMPFACYDLIKPDLLEVWLLLGQLTVFLWFTEIENIDVYILSTCYLYGFTLLTHSQAEIQVIIDDFLLAAARCSPSIIILNPKFHFLVHLPMYIQRFGPPILFSTERFESFHGIFRAGSIYSNRHAPSRDIANYFVGLDRLKHICSGGYWKEGDSWVRASSFVREFVAGHKEFYTLLGLPIQSQPVAGSITLMPRHRSSTHKPSDWSEFTCGSHLFASCSPDPAFSHFFHILSALSQTCDSIKIGSNILFQATKFGQVEALFGCTLPSGTTKYYASVKMYSVLAQKHHLFDMPVLDKNGDLVTVPIQDIICITNLQHDCAAEGKCTTRAVPERQEREDTSRTQLVIQHSNSQRYIINTQGLHSIKHIRRALDPSLLEWWGLQVDPGVVCQEAVQKLASATANKALQAKAHRTAKESFRLVMEGATTMASESELDQQPAKQQRTQRSTRTTRPANQTGTSNVQPSLSATQPPPTSGVQTTDSAPLNAPLFTSHVHPTPSDTSPTQSNSPR
ncbi:unnamed protein product [Rhizoctonia solani]|uniref:Uncharacterized protein n=1 Tax=Rhizoctonia solani TaxID=456999 RepID=A0A8H2Y654_9AGAM|nr:unnamed protein product [Rhizoctonia solani]